MLRKYIAEIRVTRPYLDATPRLSLDPSPVTQDSSDEVIAAELSRHPDTIRWRRAAIVELRKLGFDP